MEKTHYNTSLNNRVLVEPYKKTELRAEIKGGMAVLAQKVTLKGLKLMANAEIIYNGNWHSLNEGDVVYFREDQLHMSPSIKDVMTADCIDGPFIVLDAGLIQFARQVFQKPKGGWESLVQCSQAADSDSPPEKSQG